MGVLALSAGLAGRQNTSLFALFLAATVMVLFDPSIISSISFMLSFSATLGIILLDPLLKLVLKKSYFEDFRTTLSAQIATTPILLFFFGTYSLISIPANFLVLWTVPPLMALGFVSALFSILSPLFGGFFAVLSMPLLAYFLAITDFLSRFDIGFELKELPWALIAGYYLILLAAIIRLHKSVKIKA
jgi:competence protein ComEC